MTNREELYQVIGYKSCVDIAYPSCGNCFRRVVYLDQGKKLVSAQMKFSLSSN